MSPLFWIFALMTVQLLIGLGIGWLIDRFSPIRDEDEELLNQGGKS